MTEPPLGRLDLVEEAVLVNGERFSLLRPPSAENLIDEEEFAVDERLPYWAELWPSGRALADALAACPLAGLRVVELGSGLGLASFVAARRGATVLATDWYRDAVDLILLNAERLRLNVEALIVDWRHPPQALLARAPFDVVLAADVLYEARNVAPLRALLPRLTAATGRVLLADPRRPDARALLEALRGDGWTRQTTQVAATGGRDASGPRINLHRLRPPGE